MEQYTVCGEFRLRHKYLWSWASHFLRHGTRRYQSIVINVCLYILNSPPVPFSLYGASRLFDHKVRRRVTFALLTFRHVCLIFRTFIVRGQMRILSFVIMIYKGDTCSWLCFERQMPQEANIIVLLIISQSLDSGSWAYWKSTIYNNPSLSLDAPWPSQFLNISIVACACFAHIVSNLGCMVELLCQQLKKAILEYHL